MYDYKPGQKREINSLVDMALEKAELLLHKDTEKGLKYYRLAVQHYNNLEANHPDFEWIEFRLESLLVAYFKKQAGFNNHNS